MLSGRRPCTAGERVSEQVLKYGSQMSCLADGHGLTNRYLMQTFLRFQEPGCHRHRDERDYLAGPRTCEAVGYQVSRQQGGI